NFFHFALTSCLLDYLLTAPAWPFARELSSDARPRTQSCPRIRLRACLTAGGAGDGMAALAPIGSGLPPTCPHACHETSPLHTPMTRARTPPVATEAARALPLGRDCRAIPPPSLIAHPMIAVS